LRPRPQQSGREPTPAERNFNESFAARLRSSNVLGAFGRGVAGIRSVGEGFASVRTPDPDADVYLDAQARYSNSYADSYADSYAGSHAASSDSYSYVASASDSYADSDADA